MKFRELLNDVTGEIYRFCRASHSRSVYFVLLLVQHWRRERDPALFAWIEEKLKTDVQCEDPRTHESYDWPDHFDIHAGPDVDEILDRKLVEFLGEMRVLAKYSDVL